MFLRFLCTKSSALSRALQLRTWCKDSRKALFLRFLCTKSSALSRALQIRTWCKDSRKALFFRFLCTKSSALSPRHRARSVPPQSESTSGAHPSHFHKSKRKRHPRRRFPLLPLFEGNPRPGISDCSFPRKTHRHPGGVFRQKFPFLFLQGNFRHVFPEGLPANTPNGTPEKIPISPSLPTSFPSAGQSLPCRRCWRKPSRSRFCPGSGQPSSSPARNPHRPCRNPFSPPE